MIDIQELAGRVQWLENMLCHAPRMMPVRVQDDHVTQHTQHTHYSLDHGYDASPLVSPYVLGVVANDDVAQPPDLPTTSNQRKRNRKLNQRQPEA